MQLSLRRRNIITGLAFTVILVSLVTIGIKQSFGEFDDVYKVTASFDAAGQGLQRNSDVKIRGVNVGKVESVRLVDGRALVLLDINHSQRIPAGSAAVVRPKTLFGEKFVDIVPCPKLDDLQLTASEAGTCNAEVNGPYMATDDHATFPRELSIGGFELERVLADAYPVLKAIKPSELMTVLGTLADAGKGLGPTINSGIVNGKVVADNFARHDAETRQFLDSLAKLSTELGVRSDDLVALANSLNAALPTLNSRGEELTALLQQTSRVSGDVADLLENNVPFVDAALGPGDQVIQLLYDRRNDVIPLVVGLREYVQTLAQAIRIPVGDGTYMAAVKGLTGTQACDPPVPFAPCDSSLLPGIALGTPAPAGAAATSAGPGAAATPAAAGGASDPNSGASGVQSLLTFIGGLGHP